MRIGDRVFIHPAHSTVFAKEWGAVVGAEKNVLFVKFNGYLSTFRYNRHELLGLKAYWNCLMSHDTLYNRHTGEVISGYDVKYPFIIYKGSEIHMEAVLPVEICEKCGIPLVGEFSTVCEKCEVIGLCD